jgi:endonuclease YncB( thermonuclease family)
MSRLLLTAALIVTLAVGPATAQTVVQGGGKSSTIFGSATLQGNGADTTEDALAAYTGTVSLVNVGDVIHFSGRGVAAASTDTKTIRVKLGGISTCSANNAAAGNTTWFMDCWIMKTGASTQSYWYFNNNATNNIINNFNVTSVADTAPITLNLTAQNATTATANSIQIQTGVAQYFPAQ